MKPSNLQILIEQAALLFASFVWTVVVLAIIHLRRAIVKKPDNPTNHERLVTAYMKINRYDLADKALQEAEKFAVTSTELNSLRRELATVRKDTP